MRGNFHYAKFLVSTNVLTVVSSESKQQRISSRKEKCQKRRVWVLFTFVKSKSHTLDGVHRLFSAELALYIDIWFSNSLD